MQIIRRAPRRGRGMRGYGLGNVALRPGDPGYGTTQGAYGPPRISDDDLLAAGSGGASRTADLRNLDSFITTLRDDSFVPNVPKGTTVADIPKNALPPQLTPSGVPGSTVTTITPPAPSGGGGSSRPSLLVMGGGALLFAGVGFWLLSRAG